VPGDALIFANIHPNDLVDGDLYDPGAPLSAHAHRVVLEITERAPLEAVDRLADRVAELRRLGYRLAVDDLGAGYAGLAAFSSVAPDVVKLDMSLVRGLEADLRRQAVVASLIGLTRELGTTFVAEGVETAGERDALLALGCDHMQGYLFAMPSPGFTAPMFG
jgi:EAL domain-containing protein (putative c-di-GMP-specific phosphodiesterase class I)